MAVENGGLSEKHIDISKMSIGSLRDALLNKG
jgi:hypothetical protein